MALIVLAHPNFKQSIANKTIVEQLQQTNPTLELRNIHQLYPAYEIAVEAEQAALLRHDFIMLQFPMYWFNMPAILKQWFDQVFSYQFAYGSQGNKLKYKKLMISVTVGQPEKNFMQAGHCLMDEFYRSIKQSAEYAQMEYLAPVFLYGTSVVSGHSPTEITAKATLHGQKLQQIIASYI